MIVQRTETHIIKESNPIYGWILEECLRSRNGSLNILKRGMKFGFDFKECFFRPTKIDIQKKLLNFA